MKKTLLILSALFILSPVLVIAEENNDQINQLLEEIAELEKEVEAKKLEVQKLAFGGKEDTVEWLDMNLDVTSEFDRDSRAVTIEKMGISYSDSTPKLSVIYHVKIIGTEKELPRSGLTGSLQVETEEALDWVRTSDYDYLIKNGDSFIPGDYYDLPTKVAPGWEGYFINVYEINEPTGVYHLVDSLGGYNLKIAIYNTNEEFGTVIK